MACGASFLARILAVCADEALVGEHHPAGAAALDGLDLSDAWKDAAGHSRIEAAVAALDRGRAIVDLTQRPSVERFVLDPLGG